MCVSDSLNALSSSYVYHICSVFLDKHAPKDLIYAVMVILTSLFVAITTIVLSTSVHNVGMSIQYNFCSSDQTFLCNKILSPSP